jgi:transcriptional regulator with XRE-family HTH domain
MATESPENSFENVKIAVALRTARAAIGWNQDEFAALMGVAKSTIARIETLEMGAKADFLNKAMRLFREAGVTLDLYDENILPVTIGRKALLEAVAKLQNDDSRRSDRLATRRAMAEAEAQGIRERNQGYGGAGRNAKSRLAAKTVNGPENSDEQS